MLDGLDAAEIRISDIRAEWRQRMDAEYFSKRFTANSAMLSGFPSIATAIDRRPRAGVKNLRLSREFNYLEISGVELDGMDYSASVIPPDEIPDRATHILRDGDIVVSTVRPGRNAAALIRKPHRLAATSGFAVLRAKGVAPECLFAWCKTRFFVLSMVRETTATMYPAVSFRDIARARFFPFGGEFAERIQLAVGKAGHILDESKALYQSAESKLLEGVGMAGWRPEERLWTVKSFSEILGAGGRWDAEYHAPKYDELLDALRRAGCAPLDELADLRKSVEPGSDAYRESGIPFLRVADFSKFGFSTPVQFLDPDEYGGAMAELKPRKDSVLLTKDGTVGIACRMAEDMDAITSGAILHLTVKPGAAVSPDCLALALNSMPVRMQAERDAGGIVIRHWRPDEIRAALIPVPPPEKRRELDALSRESFRLRRESKRLLNAAVRAVECAVEKGEKAGLEILEELTG